MNENYAQYCRLWYTANKERLAKQRREKRLLNPENHKRLSAKYYAANTEKVKIRTAERQRANREECAEYTRKWRRLNPEKAAACDRAYRLNNLAKNVAKVTKRRADKSCRTPVWADIQTIEQFYSDAREFKEALGHSFEIDHVIPLRGRRVSGLHVHTNLQILPKQANAKKHNCFEVA